MFTMFTIEYKGVGIYEDSGPLDITVEFINDWPPAKITGIKIDGESVYAGKQFNRADPADEEELRSLLKKLRAADREGECYWDDVERFAERKMVVELQNRSQWWSNEKERVVFDDDGRG